LSLKFKKEFVLYIYRMVVQKKRDEEMVPGKYHINKMSAFRSYFQFFKKRPKGHFRGQFQKYSALKVVYWVIEFWPYLSWF